ncbi:PspC domain-containing protein, partial [bacterium]|nr:PspC domain-containing protein [bacterium]
MKRKFGHSRHHKFRNHNKHTNGSGINSLRRGLYRSRHGLFMGVCRGLSDHFNLNLFWVRVSVLLVFLFTGFWPIGVIYIIAGLLLKVEPVTPLRNEKEEEFYD